MDEIAGAARRADALEDDEAGPELEQIRVFLVRDGVDSPEGALRPDADGTRTISPISAQGIEGHLVIDRPRERRPDWVPFLEELGGRAINYDGNRHMSAILFIRRDSRVYALTFGFGRHMLRADAFEPEFGLRTAAGLVDPEGLASIDSRAFEATVLQVRRQSSRGTGARAIGLDIGREMLRALAGQLRDEELGTRVTGSDSLGLTSTLNALTLGSRLDALGRAYDEKGYLASFGYLDRWRQVRGSDAIHDDLDGALEAQLAKRWELVRSQADPEHLPDAGNGPRLTAPQVIEYSASGFITNVEANTAPRAFPDLDAYLSALRKAPTLSQLRTRHDLLLMAAEPFAVQEVWPIYRTIVWEVALGDDTYVLMDGTWWQVDAEYRKHVDDRLLDIPLTTPDLPPFDPNEDEPDYNDRLAKPPNERALIDRRTARFQDEEGGVEPCDVFTSNRQFIHVKRMTSSAAMSHLFGQALVAARLFQATREYRTFMRGLLAPHQGLVDLIPLERPTTPEYTIIMGIITRPSVSPANSPVHVALDLPFLARNFLGYVATEIEGMGYRFELARIRAVANSRPADAGPLRRIKDGVDPNPVRWAARPRRARRRRGTALVRTTGDSTES